MRLSFLKNVIRYAILRQQDEYDRHQTEDKKNIILIIRSTKRMLEGQKESTDESRVCQI